MKDRKHALAEELPEQCDESSVGWSTVQAVSGATVVIESSTGDPLLTYRTDVGGTVIHVNHDMTYSSSTIGENVLQVLVNCARFVAR